MISLTHTNTHGKLTKSIGFGWWPRIPQVGNCPRYYFLQPLTVPPADSSSLAYFLLPGVCWVRKYTRLRRRDHGKSEPTRGKVHCLPTVRPWPGGSLPGRGWPSALQMGEPSVACASGLDRSWGWWLNTVETQKWHVCFLPRIPI